MKPVPQPTRKLCRNGHVIPLNGSPHPISGEILRTPLIACPLCALEAGGVISVPSKPLRKGKKPEGQETFLDDTPPTPFRLGELCFELFS